MKIEIVKNKNGEYYGRFLHDNGNVAMHSETYKNKKDCVNNIEAIRYFCKANIPTESIFKKRLGFVDNSKELNND